MLVSGDIGSMIERAVVSYWRARVSESDVGGDVGDDN